MSAEIPNRHGKMEGKGKNHKSRDCIAMGRLCFRRECGYKVEQVKCDICDLKCTTEFMRVQNLGQDVAPARISERFESAVAINQ